MPPIFAFATTGRSGIDVAGSRRRRRSRWPIALAVLALPLGAVPSLASTPVERACIAAAGAPGEPLLASGEGVAMEDIDSVVATAACTDAMRRGHPRSPVGTFRQGRALLAAGQHQDLWTAIRRMSMTWGLAKMAKEAEPARADVFEWYRAQGEAAMTPATYEAAAEAGDPWAQTVLAHLYGLERGVVPKDAQLRKRWLDRAVAQDYTYALYLAGHDAVQEGRYEEARDLLETAAGRGLAIAAHALFRLHAESGGLPNPELAAAWLRQAAFLGHEEAIRIQDADGLSAYERSLMGRDGIAVPADYPEPTAEEILLAYVRAHCGSGRCLDRNRFTYGVFRDQPIYEVTVLDMEKRGCDRDDRGFYVCSFAPRISVGLVDRGYAPGGRQTDALADFMNRNQVILTLANHQAAITGSYQHRHAFHLTSTGWRSPDLALFSMNGNPLSGLGSALELETMLRERR